MSDNWLRIERVANGFILKSLGETEEYYIDTEVIADAEDDELSAGQELLWRVVDYFNLGGSRHDAQRLTITREKGDKYEE